MPGPEEPACASTGWRCGLVGMFSGPWTRKNSPSWSIGCSRDRSRYSPDSRSTITAPSSQESQRRRTTSTNSVARRYRVAGSGASSIP